jgi:3-oxoadipate enol-lactonase
MIVLVHAGVCDSRMWEGFDLPGAMTYEMRGFGETPMPSEGQFSHAADLEAAIGEGPASLVGASYGGLVCLELAARRPDLITELVLLDAALPDHPWSDEVAGYGQREEELVDQGDLRGAAELSADFWLTDPSLRERVVEMQQRAYELQVGAGSEEIYPEAIPLAEVRARTLVVVGENDKADFHDIADRLMAEVPGARGIRIKGSGHLPALEQPAETARIVRDFLAKS